MYLVGFPLLLIPFAIYNIIAFLIPGVGWTDALTRVSFPAGGEWAMSLGDMLVAVSILLLLVELCLQVVDFVLQGRLAQAKSLLTLFLEVLADGGTKHFLQPVVEIDKGHAQTARELASHGGFAGAGHADQRTALAHGE